jgi:WD40 repeat protein
MKENYLNGELMRRLEGFVAEFTFEICSLEENLLAVCYGSSIRKIFARKIRILNANVGSVFRTLLGHADSVLALAKLSSFRLASGSADTTVKIWNWCTGLLERNLTGHTSLVFDLILMIDNQTLLSSSCDATIRLWNTSSGNQLRKLSTQDNCALSIILLSNSRYLIAADENSTIRVWNYTSREVTKVHFYSVESEVLCLVALDHTSYMPLFASGSKDSKIIIWNCESGKEIKTVWGHSYGINSLIMLPTGHLASASGDGTVRIWNLKGLNGCEVTLNMTFVLTDPVASLAVLSDGNLAISPQWGDVEIRYFGKNSNYSGRLNVGLKTFIRFLRTSAFSSVKVDLFTIG